MKSMRSIIVVLLSLLMLTSKAQVDSTLIGKVVDSKVVIEKELSIKLPVANKIQIASKNQNQKASPLDLSYDVVESEFKWPNYESEVDIIEFKEQFPQAKYQNSIKAGFGNYSSPLFELRYFLDKNNFNLASSLYHESFNAGPVSRENSASSVSHMALSSNHEFKSVTISPTLRWKNDRYRFYGNTQRLISGFSSEDASKASTNHVELGAILRKKQNSSNFLLSLKGFNTNQSMINGANLNEEHGIYLEGGFDSSVDKTINLGVKMTGNVAKYRSRIVYDRSLFSVTPWVSHETKIFLIKVGLSLAAENSGNEKSHTGLYPSVSSEWRMNSKWTVFGTVDSGIHWKDLNSSLNENQFLIDSLELRNSETQIGLGGGIKGALTNNLLLKTGIKFSKNQSIGFYLPTADSTKFGLVYDSGITNIFTISGDINYSPTIKTELGIKLKLNAYSTDTLEKAWHLPAYTYTLYFSRYVEEKIFINAEIISQGGIKAPRMFNGEVLTLKNYVDVNINVDYKVSDRFFAFLKVNNLFNKEYEKYIGYPVRGASIKIGGKYRF